MATLQVLSQQWMRGMGAAIARALDLDADVELWREYATSQIKCLVEVPDMVPALRKHVIVVDDDVIALSHGNALVSAVHDVAEIVYTERELRPWCFCDL